MLFITELKNLQRFFIFFLFFTQFTSTHSFAALTDQERANQQDNQAKQRIESERQNLIREKESDEIKNIQKSKSKKTNQLQSEQNLDDKICRKIKNFVILGNQKVFSSTLKRKFITPFFKDSADFVCLTKLDLAKIRDDIENYYLTKGYVLARVYFDATNLSEGEIKIIIEEGKLEKLEIRDNSKINDVLPFRRNLQKFFAFPYFSNDSDDVVNLRDVEQGLDQINRLGSQAAKMTMDSGSKAGYSNITIDNQIENLTTLGLAFDNSGQISTGKQKRKVSLNQDNLLGINDNIYLNYSESNGMPLFGSSRGFNNFFGVDDNSNTRFSKAFYSAISFPFGYWTLGATYSYSSYLLTTSGTATTFKSSGNSELKTYYVDRVLSRGQKYKISLKGELTQSDTDSYLEGTYIAVNSRNLTAANFYLNNIFYLPNGTLYIQPKYSRGLTAFGSLKDQRNLTRDKPRAQFETFGLYAQSNLNFNFPATSLPLNHKLTFDSLKSQDSLYGYDQFSLGGRYTIRGFQESMISGDNGYSIKNDLSARVSDLLPVSFLNSDFLKFGSENFLPSTLSKLRLGIFYDYGYVRNHVIDAANDKGYMSGAGASISYLGKNFNAEITYSKGLHSPQFLRGVDNISKDNETIYFSLSFNLNLF
jgi:hemolysin activation/secretion protein